MARTRALLTVVGLAAALAACQTDDDGARRPRLRLPMIQQPPACETFSVSIYFEPASAAVTREADALLRSAAGRAKRCKVDGVDVVGLADAAGASEANLQISKERASAVTEALARHGFANATVSSAAGEAGAAVGNGEQRPLRRRADVTFHLEAKPRR